MATVDPLSYAGLDRLGRIRLSSNFHMREFCTAKLRFITVAFVPDADRVDDAVTRGQNSVSCFWSLCSSSSGVSMSGRGTGAVWSTPQVWASTMCCRQRCFHTWDHRAPGMDVCRRISMPAVSAVILSGEVPFEAVAWWMRSLPEWSFWSLPRQNMRTRCVSASVARETAENYHQLACGRAICMRACRQGDRQDSVQMLLRACGRDTLHMPGVR